MKWLMAALCLLPLSAAAANLQVSGNKIRYKGNEIQLQGVALGDPLLTRKDRPAEDYHFLAQDWHANAVRFSIHPSTWRDYGRVNVLAALEAEINRATEAGLFVILAWHAIGAPYGYYQAAPEGMPPDAYDSDFELARDFWKHASQRFARNGRVVFELWNEPVFSENETPVEPQWARLKPHWEELTALIREQGAKNLLLATGSQWSYDLRGIKNNLLADGNTAYAWHIYAGIDNDSPTLFAAKLDGLDEVKPVVVTEWGFDPLNAKHQGTADSFGYNFRTYFLQGRKLHHLAWCWHPVWTPRMLEADWRTPTAFGFFVKETLWERPELARP